MVAMTVRPLLATERNSSVVEYADSLSSPLRRGETCRLNSARKPGVLVKQQDAGVWDERLGNAQALALACKQYYQPRRWDRANEPPDSPRAASPGPPTAVPTCRFATWTVMNGSHAAVQGRYLAETQGGEQMLHLGNAHLRGERQRERRQLVDRLEHGQLGVDLVLQAASG